MPSTNCLQTGFRLSAKLAFVWSVLVLFCTGAAVHAATPTITINSTPTSPVTEGVTVVPFSSVSVMADATVDLQIAMSPVRAGTINDPDWTLQSGGIYEYTGSPLNAANAVLELESLVFEPNDNLAPEFDFFLGNEVTIELTVEVSDTSGSDSDSVQFDLQGSNSEPFLLGSLFPSVSTLSDIETTRPFSNASVSDPDGDELFAIITITSVSSDVGETVSGVITYPDDPSVVTDLGGGVYAVFDQVASDMEVILRDLEFDPDDNQLDVLGPGTRPQDFAVTIELAIADGAGLLLEVFDSDDVNINVWPFNDPPEIGGADSFGSPSSSPNDANRFIIPDKFVDVAFASADDDLIVTIGPHDLSVDTEVRVILPAGAGSLPSDFSFQPYFVVSDGDSEDNTLQLSTSQGGTPVDIQSDIGAEELQLAAVSVLELFSGLSLSDVDNRGTQPLRVEVIAVRLQEDSSGETGGDFSDAPLGLFHFPTAFSMDPAGEFVFQGSQTDVASFLQSVRFVPEPNLLPVGEENLFEIILEVTDVVPFGLNLEKEADENFPEDDPAIFWIRSINDPPSISTSVNPTSVVDTHNGITPFRIEIADPDPLDEAFRVVMDLDQGDGTFGPTSPFATLSPESPEFPPLADPPDYLSSDEIEFQVANVRFRPVRNSTDTTETVNVRFRVTDRHGLDGLPEFESVDVIGVNDPPDILNFTNPLFFVNDDEPLLVFENIRIDDVDSSIVDVSISLDGPDALPDLAVFDPSGPFENLSPADVTAQLAQVEFQPVDGIIPTGEDETVEVTVTVTDAGGEIRSKTGTVVILGVNSPPEITFAPPLGSNPRDISPLEPKPFDEVTITDDETDPVTVEVALETTGAGVLENIGVFTEIGVGVYRFTGDPSAAAAAMNDMEFVPSDSYPFPPNSPIEVAFQVRATDTQLAQTQVTVPIILQEASRNLLVWDPGDDLDSGGEPLPGTLRYAVHHASSGDYITMALPSYPETIRLNSPIVFERNVTLKGPGADKLTVSGDSNGDGVPDTQLFVIRAGVVIEGLTLTEGTASTGGAISVQNSGRLTLRGSAVTHSRATLWGGGIDVNEGGLVVENSVIHSNEVDADSGQGGGGIAVYTSEPVRIHNTTFAANFQSAVSGVGGGALYVENATPETPLIVEIRHGTFAENQDAADQGSSILANVFGTKVHPLNSIFADRQGRNLQIKGSADFVSEGGNISDDTALSFLVQDGVPKAIKLLDHSSDRTELDPVLLSLGTHNSPTAHYKLSEVSPAIDTARNTSLMPAAAIDQLHRIRDDSPDVGAVEYSSLELVEQGKAPQQVLINEIQFNGVPSNFVELYIPRDAGPTDISGFGLWVDGVEQHVFDPDTVLIPGNGIIVSEASITTPAPTTPPNAPAAEVVVVSALDLTTRSVVEVRRPGTGGAEDQAVASANYVGVFVNPALEPEDPAQPADIGDNSITLVPQFMGFAFLPHGVIDCAGGGAGDVLLSFASLPTSGTSSPGADSCGNAFGENNSNPVAETDTIIVSEDLLRDVAVLENDFDADGADRIVVTGVSGSDNGPFGATDQSVAGSELAVVPDSTPLRGESISYDPRIALNHLPEGIEAKDEFFYLIADLGTGIIIGFEDPGAGDVIVVSPGHRLIDGVQIEIFGGTYEGVHTVGEVLDGNNEVDPDRFTLQGESFTAGAIGGSWETVEPRSEFNSSLTFDPHLGTVQITVLGANDPPIPMADEVETTEDQILRIMADPHLAGSTSLVMDTDDLYPEPRAIWDGSLLQGNSGGSGDDDVDPDSDDDATTLQVVGVVGEVFEIDGYSRGPAGQSVIVKAVGHGLEDGDQILLANYPGHPSYNGFHEVTVVSKDAFSIPVLFVDKVSSTEDLWTMLTDENRLAATSEFGASVALEIRDDRKETNVIYNPRDSAYLNGLSATDPSEDDFFYYAVQDRHGAIGIARVKVTVFGVNDDPIPGADPSSLANLASLLNNGSSLEQILAEVDVDFYIPPTSGLDGRHDVRILTDGSDPQGILLTDLYSTDQDTSITIATTGPGGIVENDDDPDLNDVSGLMVSDVSEKSREGATVSLNAGLITYDPTTPATLSILDVAFVDADTDVITTVQDHHLTGGEAVAVTVKNGQDLPEAVSGQKRYYVLPVNLGPNMLRLSVAPGGVSLDFGEDVGEGVLEIRSGNQLRMLARGEAVIDTFEAFISDGNGGTVPSWVAVLVTGKNESPLARDDVASVEEDEILSLPRLPEELALIPEFDQTGLDRFGVLANDTDPDINGVVPDDILALVSIRNLNGSSPSEPDLFSSLWAISPETGATLVLEKSRLTYDPTTSLPDDPTHLKSLKEGDVFPEYFVYSVMDGSFVFAVNDVFKAAADNSNLFLPVLVNDRNLTGNGQELTIVEVGTPSNGGEADIALDAEDRPIGIHYTPEVDFVGNEYFTYVISDEDGNTDRAVVSIQVTVNQLNGNLQANDDHFTVARGEESFIDVLANDNIIPQSGASLTLTRILTDPQDESSAVEIPDTGVLTVSLPSGDSLTVENNQVIFLQDSDSFVPDSAQVDNASFAYEVSGGGIARAIAEVNVSIVDRGGTLHIRDDSFSILAGSVDASLDVLANDNILPGSTANLRILSASEPDHGTLVVNPEGTALIYTPNPGFVGEDTFFYEATDNLGGTGGGGDGMGGNVTVKVGNLIANMDFLSSPFDSEDDNDDALNATNAEEFVMDVLANDQVLHAAGRPLEIESVSPTSVGSFGRMRVADDNQSLLFNPAFEATGEHTFTYVVKDGSENTTTGTAIVVIVQNGAAANPDFFSVNVDSEENELNVLLNDASFPPSSQGLSIVEVGTGLDAPNHGGSVVVSDDGTQLIYTPAPGFRGEETFGYTMTDSRQTDSTKVVVRVDSGLLSANADEFTVFYDPLPMDKVLLFDVSGGLLDQFGRSGMADGEFTSPSGIARGGGRMAVADTGNDRIQIFDNTGNLLQVIGSTGSGPGQFDAPGGVDLDSNLNVVIADTENNRVQIFDDQGNFLARFGSAGITPGHLKLPADVASLPNAGNDKVVVADTGNDRIQVFDDQGDLVAIFGNSGSRPGEFNRPSGVGVDAAGNIWVADTGNHRIQKFTATGTWLESFGSFGSGAGDFNLPADVTVDSNGRVLIADTGNHRVQIRDLSGQFLIVQSFQTGDATENFNRPASIAVDAANEFAVLNQREQALQQFTLPVLANDRVLPDFGQVISITGVGVDDPELPAIPEEQNAPDRLGSVEITPDGASLIYIPRDEDGPFPYTEQFTYEISDGTERRASTTITIHVERRINLRDLDTNDDAFTVQNDSQNNVLAVLANDDIKPANAAGWSITELTDIQPPAADPEGQQDILVIQDQILFYTPEPGFVGTKTFFYSVSDGVGGTGQAQVTITVGDLPVSRDEFVALSGFDSTPPETVRLDVLANDNLLPRLAQGNVDPRDDFILPLNQTITPDQGGEAEVTEDDEELRYIDYTPAEIPPAGTEYPYLEKFVYAVESDSGETVEAQVVVSVHEAGSDRAAALLTINVIGVNDLPIVQGLPNGDGELDVYHKLPIHPYAGITITDFDAEDDICIRVELDNTTNGTLIPSSDPLCADQDPSEAVYEVCGLTPEQAELCLRALIFMPAGNATPGSPEVTQLTLDITDQSGNGILGHETIINAHHPQVARQEATDGDRNDEFGFSVGASRDTVVAGAPFDDDSLTGETSFNKTGSAYTYERNVPSKEAWSGESKHLASDAVSGDEFGHAVDISGDGNTMVIGARKGENGGVNTGSAYVMERATDGSGEWQETFKLIPPSGGSTDEFGYSVAISRDGNTVVVGANHNKNGNASTGSAYVFERNLQPLPGEDAWILVNKLFPSDGANDDEYGRSVAVSTPYILVGSPRHTPNNKRSGAVYLYKLVNGSWNNLIGKFQPAAGDNGDEFGHSVAIHGDRFAAGAPLDEEQGQKSGTVYLYGLNAGIIQSPVPSEPWGLIKLMQADQSADFDQFGYSVALNGHLLLAGARHDEVNGRRSGSVSVYHREDPTGAEVWDLLEFLIPNETNLDDEFGFSMSIDGGTAVVGARREEASTGKRFGAVYIYRFKFNNPPTVATLPPGDVTLEIGESRTISIFASDPDLHDSVVSVDVSPSNLPWVVFDPNSLEIRLNEADILQNIDVGLYALHITATDEDGATHTHVLNVEVIPERFPEIDLTAAAQLTWVNANLETDSGQVEPVGNRWGAWADPDLDGLSNFEEYAFGKDPMTPDADQSDLSIVRHGNEIFVVYLRRTNDPTLEYLIETSIDMKQWSSQTVPGGSETAYFLTFEFEEVWVRLDLGETATGQYFRIRVQ